MLRKNKNKCFLKGRMWWVIAAAEAAMVMLDGYGRVTDALKHDYYFCCQCIRCYVQTAAVK